MTLTVKYFGMLTEATHCSEEQVPLLPGAIFDLISMLIENTLPWRVWLSGCSRKQISGFETDLSGGEIALLPPFAGGWFSYWDESI